MENKHITLTSAMAVAKEHASLWSDNSGTTWDYDNLIAAICYDDEPSEEGYYCVSFDGDVGFTADDGIKVEWLYKVSVTQQQQTEPDGYFQAERGTEMNATEATKLITEWEAARTGLSPLAGNRTERHYRAGNIIRDEIATLSNGIKIFGYRDKQNRLVAILHEA